METVKSKLDVHNNKNSVRLNPSSQNEEPLSQSILKSFSQNSQFQSQFHHFVYKYAIPGTDQSTQNLTLLRKTKEMSDTTMIRKTDKATVSLEVVEKSDQQAVVKQCTKNIKVNESTLNITDKNNINNGETTNKSSLIKKSVPVSITNIPTNVVAKKANHSDETATENIKNTENSTKKQLILVPVQNNEKSNGDANSQNKQTESCIQKLKSLNKNIKNNKKVCGKKRKSTLNDNENLSWVNKIKCLRVVHEDEYYAYKNLPENFWRDNSLPPDWDDKEFHL